MNFKIVENCKYNEFWFEHFLNNGFKTCKNYNIEI